MDAFSGQKQAAVKKGAKRKEKANKLTSLGQESEH